MSGFLNRNSLKARSVMVTNVYLGYWSVLKVLKLLKCAKLESHLKKGKKEPPCLTTTPTNYLVRLLFFLSFFWELDISFFQKIVSKKCLNDFWMNDERVLKFLLRMF